MGRNSEADTLKLRQHILHTTKEEIRESGSTPTMRDLAEKAGTNTRTAYNLFGSKRQLFVEVLQNDILEDAFSLTLSFDDDLEQVLSHIDLVAPVVLAKSDFVRTLVSGICTEAFDTKSATDILSGPATTWVLRNYKGSDIEEVADRLTCGVVGALFLWVGGSIPSEKITDRIKTIIIDATNSAAPD